MKSGATYTDKQHEIRQQNEFFGLFLTGVVASLFLIAFIG